MRIPSLYIVLLLILAATTAEKNEDSSSHDSYSSSKSSKKSGKSGKGGKGNYDKDGPLLFHYGETKSLDKDCEAVVMDYDGVEDLILTCLTDDYQFLVVPKVNSGWIKEKVRKGKLKSGKTRLKFPAGTAVNGFLIDHAPELLDNKIAGNGGGRRRLDASKRISNSTIAIFRVSDDFYGKSTTPTAATLRDTVLTDQLVNIRTQTSNCSFSQLNLKVGTGILLTDGVGTITPGPDPGNGDLTDFVEEGKFFAYLNDIIGQFFVANGNSIPVDFIQICLPPDTITSSQSLGFLNSFLTVFNSPVCSYLSYNMHEFGHNLNIENSADLLFSPGLNSNLGDTTGYMGEFYDEVQTPRMCFNPAKSFQLGWYTSKTYHCTPTIATPCTVDIAGFVNYDNPSVEWVLMKINDPLSDIDYYLTYNDASGFNSGTKEGINQVVINTLPNEGDGVDVSELVGKLSAGQTAYYLGTFNGNQYLAVEVLSITNGVASIEVTTGDGIPPGSLGDPHFRTWQNEHYEYHGQCDLVLVKDPTFCDNKGLEVQIRTKVIRYWSYIQSVAIRIGTDILEVQGNADYSQHQGIVKYWFNLEYQANVTSMANGLFPVTIHVRSERKRIVAIDLNAKYPNQKIIISTWKEFVKVDFVHATKESYGNSVGMLGDFQTGRTLARDGVTEMNDFWQFGEEWQVLPGTDDMLFHAVEYPQFPEKCVEPEEALGKQRRRQRRLEESDISTEEAEMVCSKHLKHYADPLAIQDCVYDVLATQDVEIVDAF